MTTTETVEKIRLSLSGILSNPSIDLASELKRNLQMLDELADVNEGNWNSFVNRSNSVLEDVNRNLLNMSSNTDKANHLRQEIKSLVGQVKEFEVTVAEMRHNQAVKIKSLDEIKENQAKLLELTDNAGLTKKEQAIQELKIKLINEFGEDKTEQINLIIGDFSNQLDIFSTSDAELLKGFTTSVTQATSNQEVSVDVDLLGKLVTELDQKSKELLELQDRPLIAADLTSITNELAGFKLVEKVGLSLEKEFKDAVDSLVKVIESNKNSQEQIKNNEALQSNKDKEIADKDSLISTLKTEKEEQTKEASEAKNKLVELKSEIEEIKKTLERKEKEITITKDVLKAKSNDSTNTSKELDQLKNSLEETNKSKDLFSKEIESLKEKLNQASTLQNQLEIALKESEKIANEAKISGNKYLTDISSKEKELESKSNDLTKIKKQIEESDAKIKALLIIIAKACNFAYDNTDHLSKDLDTVTTRYDIISDYIALQKVNLASKSALSASLSSSGVNSFQTVPQLDLNDIISSLLVNSDNKVKELKENNICLEEQIEELRGNLVVMSESIELNKSNLKTKEQENKVLLERVALLENEVYEKDSAPPLIVAPNNDLNLELEKMLELKEKELNEMKVILEKYKLEKETVDSENSILNKNNEQLKFSTHRLSEQIEYKQLEFEHLKNIHKQSEKLVEELSNELKIKEAMFEKELIRLESKETEPAGALADFDANEIQNLVKKLAAREEENAELKEKLEKLKEKTEHIVERIKQDSKENEFFVDRRIVANLITKYFEKPTKAIQSSILETLGNFLSMNNEERKILGLKPTNVDECLTSTTGDKLQEIADDMYKFIVDS